MNFLLSLKAWELFLSYTENVIQWVKWRFIFLFLCICICNDSSCLDHRDYQTALEDQKIRQQMAVDDAERSHAKHSKFLNQTMEKYNIDIIAIKKINKISLHTCISVLLLIILVCSFVFYLPVNANFWTGCKNDMKRKMLDTKRTWEKRWKCFWS